MSERSPLEGVSSTVEKLAHIGPVRQASSTTAEGFAMRNNVSVVAILLASLALAGCVTAEDRAQRQRIEQLQQQAGVDAAKATLKASMSIGLDYHLKTDADWETWFQSEVGQKWINDVIAQEDATYRRAMANRGNVYTHTFRTGGTSTTCTTTLSGSSATTDCR